MSVNGGYDPQITISNSAPHLGQMSSTDTQGGIKYVQVLNGTYVGSVPGGNVPYTYVGYNSNLVALTVLPAVSTFTVTTLGDTNAAGTLRWALVQANAAAGASVVEFAPSLRGTIRLVTALPAVARSVTVNGPGQSVVAISGGGRVADGFRFVAGSTGSSLQGLSLRGFRRHGIRLEDSPGVTIAHVGVTGASTTTSIGLYATGNLAGTTVESSLFTRGRRGALLVNARDLTFGAIGRGNTLAANTAAPRTGLGTGIRAEGDLTGTVVAGNTFVGNNRGFSFVNARNLRLENNRFFRNRIAAISFEGVNTGNSMSGNTFGA
jgi:parallel beta-helix repeat protein